MSKEEILQGYLNIAQFGRSVYGVETAARHYFGVSAKDLNYLQAATIAGITKAPSTYDPTADPEKAQNRRNVVLNTMYQQGYITKEEYDAGLATPIADTLAIQPLEAGCQASGGSAFFCDYVTKMIMSDPVFGETKADREALLYRGGLDIYTTLDPTMQAAAKHTRQPPSRPDDPSQIEDSIVTIEPGTGKILAMAQNRAFDNTQDPAPNTTAVNYSVDQAHGSCNGFAPTPGEAVRARGVAQGGPLALRHGERQQAHVDAGSRLPPRAARASATSSGRRPTRTVPGAARCPSCRRRSTR